MKNYIEFLVFVNVELFAKSIVILQNFKMDRILNAILYLDLTVLLKNIKIKLSQCPFSFVIYKFSLPILGMPNQIIYNILIRNKKG